MQAISPASTFKLHVGCGNWFRRSSIVSYDGIWTHADDHVLKIVEGCRIKLVADAETRL